MIAMKRRSSAFLGDVICLLLVPDTPVVWPTRLMLNLGYGRTLW